MKFLSIIFCFCQISVFGQIVENRNILTSQINGDAVKSYVDKIREWQQTYKKNCLQSVGALPDSVKQRLLKDADAALQFKWPAVPVSLYMDYHKTGIRYNYERKNDERRKILSQLAIGELIEGNGKYLSQIIDGLYVIMNEDTWVLPAHIVLQKKKGFLPDPNETVIDLGAANTAVLVASVELMFRDELYKESPFIIDRIDAELKRRIFDPYLQHDDFWWMGLQQQAVNNWNVWINTNVLQTLFFTNLKNNGQATEMLNKILKSTDCFINQYPDDGGCDEGAAYWSEAGGKLIRMLHLLKSFDKENFNLPENSVVHKMGTYIYKVHIAGNYFVNFADAFAKLIPNTESVYRYGELFNDDTLKEFAAYLFSLQKQNLPNANFVDFLETSSIYKELMNTQAKAPMPAIAWFPQREVLTMRSVEGSLGGLFAAIQGGNNGESHNHNDVGNFILYANGNPVIIDVGVGSYTAKTFSSERYSLWNMQSQWHNCPTINGYMQQDGLAYKAADVAFNKSENNISLSMNIAKAYSKNAAIKYWNRYFSLDKKSNQFIVKEKYDLLQNKDTTTLNFITCKHVEIDSKQGVIFFLNEDKYCVLKMMYNPSQFVATVENKIIDDERISTMWGSVLYRIKMVMLSRDLKGEHELKFVLAK